MVTKPTMPVEDLKSALQEALRRREECSHLHVKRVFCTSSGPANWDAEVEGDVDHPVASDCKRIALSVKLGLQNRFDAALDC